MSMRFEDQDNDVVVGMGIGVDVDDDHDDDVDPFDPFAPSTLPRSFHSLSSSDLDGGWAASSISSSSFSTDDTHARSNHSGSDVAGSPFYGPHPPGWYIQHQHQQHQHGHQPQHQHTPSMSGQDAGAAEDEEMDPETAAMLTDGMTPFDVLSSVFGATLAPSELEEALASNGYDFDRAMNWLVDRAAAVAAAAAAGGGGGHQLHHHHPHHHPHHHHSASASGVVMGGGGGPGMRAQNMGHRVSLVSRDSMNGLVRGGRGFNGVGGPPGGRSGGGGRFVNGRPVSGGNRVCRYFLAGECLRADCRFRYVCPSPVILIPSSCSKLPTLGDSSTVMTSSEHCAASGCGGCARKARRASFCIISRRR